MVHLVVGTRASKLVLRWVHRMSSRIKPPDYKNLGWTHDFTDEVKNYL